MFKLRYRTGHRGHLNAKVNLMTKTDVSQLTQLGSSVDLPANPDEAKLEKFLIRTLTRNCSKVHCAGIYLYLPDDGATDFAHS